MHVRFATTYKFYSGYGNTVDLCRPLSYSICAAMMYYYYFIQRQFATIFLIILLVEALILSAYIFY